MRHETTAGGIYSDSSENRVPSLVAAPYVLTNSSRLPVQFKYATSMATLDGQRKNDDLVAGAAALLSCL